tara:strand:+ start:1903 stop:3189 length:1287 start_codon:yes stop_codon:yes gene_type:complete
MSAHNNHVENSTWMHAVMMAGIFAVIGIILFAALGIGVANQKHEVYDDAKHAYHDAKEDPLTTSEELDHLYHEEEKAHLSFLTYRVAGITILVMFSIYAIFMGIGGLVNALQPDDEHDDHGHDDHEEHHGSASPIIFSLGVMLFLMGFPSFVVACKALMSQGGTFAFGDILLSLVGLNFIMLGIANWWKEDLPFIGHGEQIATSAPFEGEHIRKAGLWVFIMSEIMVFATFFSSYLRVRTEWCTDWAIRASEEGDNCYGVAEGSVTTASDLLRYDVATLMPGAINTFALIISSYTIVLALKTAKDKNWEAPTNFMRFVLPDKKRAIRNYLIATLLLGSLFIVLKLVEWSHLVAEGFDIGSPQGSIFYVATGAHGLHVFMGLLVMLYLIFKSDTVGYDEDNGQGIEYFGLYWHFVDLAWVVIFPAFYLY